MLQEREVVTIAFGNYSSLVAAQWANGTSHFDAHHSTLYSECRTSDVLGGDAADNTQQQQRARVPRLLLLDAPYATTFDDVEAWEDRYDAQHANNEEGDEESNNSNEALQRRDSRTSINNPRAGAAYRVDPSSVLWGNARTNAVTGGKPVDAATQRLATVAQALRQRTWAQHGLDEDDDDDDDEANENTTSDDEEAEDAYARLRRELGIAPYGDHDNEFSRDKLSYPTGKTEEAVQKQREKDDEEEEDTQHNNMPRQKLSWKERLAKLKRKLFDTRNTTIPWWQYITTGLAARSVTSVKPLQHVDAAGDIPSLHSFGYGLANLHADKKDEIQDMSDALRAQLESADLMQGVQCFTDGDGMFGGAAANLLEQFWDEAGSKTPVVNTCIFATLPSFLTDRTHSSEVAFRERRLEEAALNELLATVQLSRHPSAVYIPVPLAQWEVFFRGTSAAAFSSASPSWLQDDRATAQYLAAVLDTALYGVRDGNNTHVAPHGQTNSGNASSRDARGNARDDSTLRTQGPMYYMDDWCRVVRPAPSLRVAAAMGSLPQPVAQSTELWHFLEANPLLPDVPAVDVRMNAYSTEAKENEETGALRTGFVPLTHAMSTYSPLNAAGQVLGHAVSLRGAGVLPSTVYPTREAMLRYAMPLRTATYLPLLTESNYPISGTFPMELMFADPAAMERQLPRGFGSLRDTLHSVDVGAHVLSTYASAPMLHDTVVRAQAALRFKMDRYCTAYSMEKDDWREVVDEGLAMYDDYHHAAPSSAEGESDGDDY